MFPAADMKPDLLPGVVKSKPEYSEDSPCELAQGTLSQLKAASWHSSLKTEIAESTKAVSVRLRVKAMPGFCPLRQIAHRPIRGTVWWFAAVGTSEAQAQ